VPRRSNRLTTSRPQLAPSIRPSTNTTTITSPLPLLHLSNSHPRQARVSSWLSPPSSRSLRLPHIETFRISLQRLRSRAPFRRSTQHLERHQRQDTGLPYAVSRQDSGRKRVALPRVLPFATLGLLVSLFEDLSKRLDSPRPLKIGTATERHGRLERKRALPPNRIHAG
jgi:hypothetical protein